MNLKSKLTVMAIAPLTVLAGCGGSGPSDAIEEQIDAFVDKDAAAVCAVYSSGYLEENYEGDAAACAEEIGASLAEASEEELSTLEGTEVEVTEEAETTATASVTTAGETSTLTLVKEGEDWKIDAEE